MNKIRVGVLGATGVVGQQYVQRLVGHPWFELTFLAASSTSAGVSYQEAICGRWHPSQPLSGGVLEMPVHAVEDVAKAAELCSIVFSALGNEAAAIYEELYAAHGIVVCSNAGYHRKTEDVPVIIPEINPGHLALMHLQRKQRKWGQGGIVTKPNCSLQAFMLSLEPLHRQFGVRNLVVTTLQASSGAGYPGVSSLDLLDNIVPYIPGEESKLEWEPKKIWGTLCDTGITPERNLNITAHCNRVPVVDGHLSCLSVEFERRPTKEEILFAWETFSGEPQERQLPSAPAHPLVYCSEENRPQPRKDRDREGGMAVSIGRLRECPLLQYRWVALSHNTVRGASGGGLLTAELLVSQGYLSAL